MGLKWIAGETSVSKMSYEEKKRLFGGKVPNLQGFEYYKGGVFQFLPKHSTNSTFSNHKTKNDTAVVDTFDWRNRHGANLEFLPNGSVNPYYDRDMLGGGWLTSIKNQGSAGNCWAFANVGAIEAQINLYYNTHIDADLSEQMLVDCANFGEISELSVSYQCGNSPCYPVDEYCKILNVGIVEEECDPYAQREYGYGDENCCNYNYICSDWKDRVWKVSDFHDYKSKKDYGTSDCEHQTMNLSIEDFKKLLISKGPLNSTVNSMNHSMVLVGFRTTSDNITQWIFKNSWGKYWGDNGYAYIELDESDFEYFYGSLPIGPFIPPTGRSYDVRCIDADGDGYFNWGLGPKPADCPSCPDEPDGDDSKPCLGPMDEYGNISVILAPVAQFEADKTYGEYPLIVNFEFIDTSGNESFKNYLWEFGDGETSTEKDPIHTYLSEGDYDVTLTVKNACSSDKLKKENLILVSAPTIHPPTIIEQPIYEQVALGDTAIFRVKAECKDSIAYQWWRIPYISLVQSLIENEQGKIEGAESNELRILNISESDNGKQFVCSVNNSKFYPDSGSWVLSDTVGIFLDTLTNVKSAFIKNTEYFLHQNYPNPFNPRTTITYSIPKSGKVIVKVFDVLGNQVRTLVSKYQQQGIYNIEFNATDMNSGIYFYAIEVNGFKETKKLILLK